MDRPPGHIGGIVPVPRRELADVPSVELAAELLGRVHNHLASPGAPATFADPTFALLTTELELAGDAHDNRFSRSNVVTHMYWLESHLPGGLGFVRGKTVIELGCGALNPMGRVFTLVMAGASRGIGVDADEVVDVAAACRVMAHYAGYALLDPPSVFAGYGVSREDVARCLMTFDVKKMWAGNPDGVDQSRITFLRGNAERLDVPDGSADLVMSFAFLEHVSDPDAVVAEIARVTAPGGVSVHIIDGTDHASQWDRQLHPLGFLSGHEGASMVNGSNRLRPRLFYPLFERHGLRQIGQDVHIRVPVDAALRATFSEPFRSLPQEDLEVAGLLMVLRRD